MENNVINYPYMPPGRTLLFVPADNPWMQEAKKMADEKTGCSWWPTGAVVVKENTVIGRGCNSGQFIPYCPRVENNCPTGEGYHFCQDSCRQEGHSEIMATLDAVRSNKNPNEADLYLYGHWWCCQPCWDCMIEHGIKNVFLLAGANTIFTREKRIVVMSTIAKKISQGEMVTRQDICWTH